MADRLILHEYSRSGNCYKIRLTAALTGNAIERREYDIMKGETRTPEFLANVNANGRIPVLQVGERFLPESNAACWWLATGSSLIPQDRFAQADMLRWMFFEQYNHEPNVATLRFWFGWIGEANFSDLQRANLPAKRAAGAESFWRELDERTEGLPGYMVVDELNEMLSQITPVMNDRLACDECGKTTWGKYPNGEDRLIPLTRYRARVLCLNCLSLIDYAYSTQIRDVDPNRIQ